MKELEIRELIKKEVKNALVEELKDMQHLKLEDIKTILRNYPSYKKRIEKIKEEIEYVKSDNYVMIIHKEEGMNVQGTKEYKSEYEKKEDKIEVLNIKYNNYLNLVKKVEETLELLKGNDYYMIIHYRYFDKMTVDNIIEKMHISFGSYKRHHHLLMKEFKSLFCL